MDGDELDWQEPRERRFKPYERAVLYVLERARKPLTTASIARHANISWTAADNNLGELYSRGLIHKKERRTRTYWWVD